MSAVSFTVSFLRMQMNHRKLCRIENPYVYGVGAKPSAYHQVSAILLKMTCVIFGEKSGLR